MSQTSFAKDAQPVRATLAAVARRARVAPDTARRAILGAPSVRDYLRERVLAAARELDYQPNLVARALKGHSLRMVTIAAPEFGQLYFATLAYDLSRRLVEIGMEPTLCFDVRHAEAVAKSFSTCASILMTGADPASIQRLAAQQRVVAINPETASMPPGAAAIRYDFADAYRRLVRALHARGRRRIAVLSPHYLRCVAEGWPRAKMPFVFETLASLGLAPVAPAEGAEPVFASAGAVAAALAAAPRSIDAVVCENDLAAAALVAELAPLGVVSPRDVVVVGCDGNFRAHGAWTIRIDTAAVAVEVVRLLEALLDGASPPDAVSRLAILDDSGKEIE